MKITESIVKVLAYGYNDYPERILDEQGIDTNNMSDEEIEEKSEEILNQFYYLDEEVIYYDLEKGFEEKILYYKQDNKIFGIQFEDSPYNGIEIWNEPKEYESYEETVVTTKYRLKNETN